MADYRELLRKAVEALPENNGAARRQVYEKARTALVTQLRAIHPPLPPREITQHRLQLEDCIRQVEQQATDALLGNFRKLEEEPQPSPVIEETATGAAADEAVATPEDGGPAADFAEDVAATEAVEHAIDLPVAGEEPDEAPAPEEEPVAGFESEFESEMAEGAADTETTDTETVESGTAEAGDADPAPEDAAGEQEDTEAAPDEPARGDAVLAEPPNLDTETEDSDSAADLAELEAALRAETGNDDEPQAPDPEPPVMMAGASVVGVTRPSASVEQLIADASHEKPLPDASKPGSIGYLIAQAQAAADRAAIPARWKQDMSPGGESATVTAATALADGDTLVAERPAAPEEQTGPAVAMSAVREVEVEPEQNQQPEPADDNDSDPQGAIDRAIEALDREARGETNADAETGDTTTQSEAVIAGAAEATGEPEQSGGGNALTIFLVLFVLLLAGVGGAGYWAWQEGYIDPDAMFGQGTPATETAATQTPATPETPSEPVAQTEGPGNTAATPSAVAPVTQELGKSEDRLPGAEDTAEAEPATAAPDGSDGTAASEPETPAPSEPAAGAEDATKSEERLPTESSFDSGETAVAEGEGAETAAGQAAQVATVGPQSLLLEASAEGTTGAVPYSGTVEWSRGTDELGQPTILATANIPARNLRVDMLIRRNADPALPASHLMEVDFTVSDSFIGGAIAGLPGILLKNEELVRGTPLVGASARVVGNSFLFALSAADQDVTTNTNLLQSRKWMDLALVYATGNRAIITLEKDAEAETLFSEVISTWSEASAAEAPAADAAAAAQQAETSE